MGVFVNKSFFTEFVESFFTEFVEESQFVLAEGTGRRLD